MTTVVARIGSIIKALVSLGLETLAIGTEAAKLGAEHLDGFVDDLGKDTVATNPQGTVTDRLGEIARGLAVTFLSAVAIGTEMLKLSTKHLDGFLDDLNERITGKTPPA